MTNYETKRAANVRDVEESVNSFLRADKRQAEFGYRLARPFATVQGLLMMKSAHRVRWSRADRASMLRERAGTSRILRRL